MRLGDDLYHIGDDQPNLPVGAKNTLLLAAKRIEALTRWAKAKNGIAAAEKALLEQLKETDDDRA